MSEIFSAQTLLRATQKHPTATKIVRQFIAYNLTSHRHSWQIDGPWPHSEMGIERQDGMLHYVHGGTNLSR
jgi:hypothetical protein